MGGKSTSHSAAVSYGDSTHTAYDLRSWQGLTDVLRVAKEKLSTTEHAAFRDLVLQYAQQGGDADLRKEIDAVIVRLEAAQKPKAEPLVVVEKKEPEKTIEVETAPSPLQVVRRQSPSFLPQSLSYADMTPRTVEEKEAKEDEEETPEDIRGGVGAVSKEEETQKQEIDSEDEYEMVPVPEPVNIESESKPAQESELKQEEEDEVTQEPTTEPFVVPVVQEVSKEVAEPSVGESATPRSLDDHKARIREIKRLVNERIGNPVALVGTHKERGKEYMQALLGALKATGGGGVGVESAMRRLEDSYSTLITEKPVLEPERSEIVVPQKIVTTATQAPKPVFVPMQKPMPQKEVPTVPSEEIKIPEVVSMRQGPIPPPVPKRVQNPFPIPEQRSVPEQKPIPKGIETQSAPPPKRMSVAPARPAARVVSEPLRMHNVQAEARVSDVVPSHTVPPEPAREGEIKKDIVIPQQRDIPERSVPTPAPQSENKPLTKVAPAVAVSTPPAPMVRNEGILQRKTAQPVPQPVPEKPVPPVGFVETKYTQKKIGSVSNEALARIGVDPETTAVHQSELVSPHITEALHDLLHEWNIFASSGIFGTGPSGAEHPLYLKLAPLSMGEIITGRYEGADRRINNVIHDYVNAWRHEQGVAYTPNETFEHYLRRVVQRIQKRQGSTA